MKKVLPLTILMAVFVCLTACQTNKVVKESKPPATAEVKEVNQPTNHDCNALVTTSDMLEEATDRTSKTNANTVAAVDVADDEGASPPSASPSGSSGMQDIKQASTGIKASADAAKATGGGLSALSGFAKSIGDAMSGHTVKSSADKTTDAPNTNTQTKCGGSVKH